ncbi:MAG: ribosomal protein S18-alanine N-acetyltransferase [Burkholderiaceae bacterium]
MTASPSMQPAESADAQACKTVHAGASPSEGLIDFSRMQVADLASVEAIERAVYAYPWSMTNFCDSIASGYDCWVARNRAGVLAGYFLLMVAPDEVHLLNITVSPALHGRGIGRLLLERACMIGRAKSAPAMLLEVRPSNAHALAVYRHVGFTQIGIRKHYYPGKDGQREDALVMRLAL